MNKTMKVMITRVMGMTMIAITIVSVSVSSPLPGRTAELEKLTPEVQTRAVVVDLVGKGQDLGTELKRALTTVPSSWTHSQE
jgi:hypothetical protein